MHVKGAIGAQPLHVIASIRVLMQFQLFSAATFNTIKLYPPDFVPSHQNQNFVQKKKKKKMANLNPHMGILTWVLRDGCLMDCATVVPGLKPRPSGQSRLTETLQNTQKNTQSITCLALSVNRTASPPFNWKFTGVAATATTKKTLSRQSRSLP